MIGTEQVSQNNVLTLACAIQNENDGYWKGRPAYTQETLNPKPITSFWRAAQLSCSVVTENQTIVARDKQSPASQRHTLVYIQHVEAYLTI